MGVRYFDVGFDRAERRLSAVGLEVMRESAREGQRVAVDNAREDTREMKSKIIVVPTPDGAVLESNAEHSNFNEYGTGIEREGGGGRKTPWTYLHPRFGFVTTTGMAAQAFMRPGLDAGVVEFYRQKRQKGL